MKINKDIEIEDLVNGLPESVGYLREEGIRCLRCGEAIWGSLEDAAKEKGYNGQDIERFVKDLNKMANKF